MSLTQAMLPEFLRHPTRFTFFTGKGGVGKTSIACAYAVSLAGQGRRVLLVSTDPASNLGQVFGAPIGPAIAPIPDVAGLSAVNIEPDAAASAYRERILAPLRQASRAEVPRLEEQLSGACTTEIAAFDEFTRLLTDASVMDAFDFVIFDTAPSGHTLRLLQLPAAWSTFIEDNPRGASCLGPLSGLQAQQAQYATTVERLRDPAATTVVLVARPDSGSLKEAARTSNELGLLGIANQRVIINGAFSATDRDDDVAVALEARGERALASMPPDLAALPRDVIALKPWNIVGVQALRAFFDDALAPPQPVERAQPASLPAETLRSLIDDIAAQDHGLIMVMGKGGVGKTTIAAAIAVALADRGHHVHLSTSDPAAHLTEVVDGDVPNLTVSRIDPAVETRRYVGRALASKGKDLDAAARQVLEEDLRSPCTEEVAVFHAFSRIVSEARRGFVVLDTAPTGHTLLLLDTAGSYHREVLRTSAIPAERITTPLMRLQDPGYTRVLLAALPETTPILEAAALQEDLRRAGVEPYAWVLNQALSQTEVSDPVLRARAMSEVPLIADVAASLAKRIAIVPVLPAAPVGAEALRGLSAVPESTTALRA